MKIFRHYAVELFFKCMGAGSTQLGTNCGRVFWAFYARNCVFVQIEYAVCYTFMLDIYIYIYIYIYIFCYSCFKKKIGKNSSLCVFLFLLNSMLFGEK